MWRLVSTATILLMAPVVVNAQITAGPPPRTRPAAARQLLNKDYLTSTERPSRDPAFRGPGVRQGSSTQWPLDNMLTAGQSYRT
jgi:hypothetical protein